MTTITCLECKQCGAKHEPGHVRTVCDCGGPLFVRYDMEHLRQGWSREWLNNAPPTMWRYAAVLPIGRPSSIVSLGEGMTPLVRCRKMGARLGLNELWVKDDGVNPTGSFKARGLSCAVSMAVELGVRALAIPSAGNAASALAAYAAAAGIEAHIFMPRDVPQSNYVECKSFGAHVTLVDGLINDCVRVVAEGCSSKGWFDMSTLREPYRVEGKKTMGYEIAEQFHWQLPDVILYPTGGGVGLMGMWKAFEELEELGWTSAKKPRMLAVQAEGCRPVVDAFERGEKKCHFWERAHTVASGLRVPKPLGDFLILEILRASGGTAIAVSDAELLDAGVRFASEEGMFVAPEGAACIAAIEKLVAAGTVKPDERVLIYNTGSGLKYIDAYSTRFPRSEASQQDKLGGLITPR